MKSISVVVPVFNEEGNVEELHKEIIDTCEKAGIEYEIIFVDDGSSDRTVEICKTLKPLRLICLRRNFGQTAAMDAGIKAAKNDYIVTMDGDRQNDPADIPKLVDYLEKNNLDVVSGWRKHRKDTFFKKFTSRGANLLRSIIVKDGIHDSGCSLKIYKRECFKGINLYGEQHRFIPAILKIKGFKVGEMVVNHRARTAGVTKYNWHRTVKGFVDMISVWFWNKFATVIAISICFENSLKKLSSDSCAEGLDEYTTSEAKCFPLHLSGISIYDDIPVLLSKSSIVFLGKSGNT